MKTITIDGRTYIATAVENPQPGDRTITVDGVTYVLREETVDTVTKIVVNDKVYDIADVEAVQAEAVRAQTVEGELAEAIDTEVERAENAEATLDSSINNAKAELKRDAVLSGSVNATSDADSVTLGYRNIDSTEMREVKIPAATTESAGVMSAADKEKLDNLSQGGGVAELMEEVIYSELVALRDNASLVAGMKYRITDYVTTTVQEDTKSANHQFDVIVEAVSENELSKLAQATQHEGDTYFNDNDLEAWQLWYDLDNDTTKYKWADSVYGKGVIYRMIDEKRNDCPYDFKNILFHTTNYTNNTTSDKYYYTFSYVVGGVLYDGTAEKRATTCYDNSIGTYIINGKSSLNGNIFRNYSFTNACRSNTFRDSCINNIFEADCSYNTFMPYCNRNTFGTSCTGNMFGSSCSSNIFYSHCSSNTFMEGCVRNIFRSSCGSNIFGNNCCDNTFGNLCGNNTFGNDCRYNTFAEECGNNTLGNSCTEITFWKYTYNRKLDRDHTSITLNEEYYDDGTNALVPIKHPDLSTQPSILPYKFMGQYVYEQLIPIIYDEVINGPSPNTVPVNNKNLSVEHSKIVLMEAQLIGRNSCISASTRWHDTELKYLVFTTNEGNDLVDITDYDYIRLVYTSMPEEGGYYYNSESKKGNTC